MRKLAVAIAAVCGLAAARADDAIDAAAGAVAFGAAHAGGAFSDSWRIAVPASGLVAIDLDSCERIAIEALTLDGGSVAVGGGRIVVGAPLAGRVVLLTVAGVAEAAGARYAGSIRVAALD